MIISKRRAVLSSPSALAIAIFTTLSLTAVPAVGQTVDEVAEDNGGEIIVTARKREEDLLKTPLSLSALTSKDIAARGIVSINDVVNSTPGINVSNISSGRNDRSFQQISLRGFTPSTQTSTLTATFIDGVPVASATALNSITDPERIEILKGPQAAYFGRNTFAGAVNVVNKLPGDELGGTFSGMRGTRNNYDVQGSLEGPLISDRLTFRVTGRSFSKDGSYRNRANDSQTLGDQRTNTGTLLLVAKPGDSLTVKAFGLLSSDKDGPSAQGMISAYEIRSNNGALNVPFVSRNSNGTVIVPSLSNCSLNGFTAGLSATEARVARPFICGAAPKLAAGFSPSQNTNENALLREVLADGRFRYISPSDGVQGYGLKRRYYHLHLNVDYDVGDTGVTLSSLTGYNNEYYSELADLDNYDSTLLRNPANPTGANQNLLPYWDFPFVVERGTRDFSQEFRASYDNDGPLQAIIGASYLLTKSDSDLVSVNGAIVGGFPRASSTRSAPQKSKTYGVFFGVTYQITERFNLSAEGRYQSDEIFAITGGNIAGLTIRDGNGYGLPAGTYGPLETYFSKKFKKFLPRVIAQYEFNDDVMTYASYSKGANISLGSFNTNFLNGSPTIQAAAATIDLGVIVQPETLDNYEVGLKGKFFDNRLRVAISAYYARWKDQANVRTIRVTDEPPPAGTGSSQIVSGIANSGDVTVKGIELDVTATPVAGLSINLAGALNDSSIRSFSDPAISVVTGVIDGGFRGNQLPSSSKYSANLGVQYGTDIAGWDDGSWFVRGDLSYKSKQFVDPANLTWIKGRALADFRVGIGKGAFTLEAFVKNVFNDTNYISIANNSVLVPDFSISGVNGYVSVGLPDLRTVGLKGSVRF